MNIFELLLNELESEMAVTRKMLALVPEDNFDWAPHEKSMKMKALASHIAELPSWIKLGLTTDELDFAATPYEEAPVSKTADLLVLLEKSYLEGKESLSAAKEETLAEPWVLRNGEQLYANMTKYEIVRVSYSQLIHHRAQLGVYLRLLNIPIPGTYGPSADDQSF